MQPFGKYQLLEPVASGGMAEVYRAVAPGPAGFVKEVALKLIRGDHGGESEFVRMFIQEARLASRLNHGNVVQVFDFDAVEGRYYIAMEYVRGHTLRGVVDRCREAGFRLGLARSVHVCAEVAKGLAHAHRLSDAGEPLGLVHRDVSPQNILISFEGEVKLTDFGIARAAAATGLTEPGTLKGKVAYMAPEQARGDAVDGRADVFSLGVVLWELCAGRRLFARDSEVAALSAVLGEEPISPPSTWNEEVTPELDALVLGALERDPARRTASAELLATALSGAVLRLAREPEDLDLRDLMHRLWPSGAEPVPVAPLVPGAPLDVTRPARPAAPLGDPIDDERSTRTSTVVIEPAAGRSRRRRRVTSGVAAVAVLGAIALVVAMRTVRPERSAKREVEGPTATTRGAPPHPDPLPGGPSQSVRPERSVLSLPKGAESKGAPPTPVLIRASSDRLYSLPLPLAESGEGILSVNATPWGHLFVDGEPAGYTPREVRLPAGKHRVRVAHPSAGSSERSIVIEPGARRSWVTRLQH